MELYQKIVTARKQKGLTQEQLADLANVTVRTIQRIENGGSTPRAYTLKTIATVLGLNFEELVANNGNSDALTHTENKAVTTSYPDSQHFLKMLCLSCFSYLVIPFIHILIPIQILKKSNETNPKIIAFAQKMIRIQLYWKITFWLLLLATLGYNLIMAVYFNKLYLINYLIPFFAMYFINAIIISINLVRIKKMDTTIQLSGKNAGY